MAPLHNFYYTIVEYTMAPILVSMVLLVAHLFRRRDIKAQEGNEDKGIKERKERKGSAIYFEAFLILSFLVLSPVSTKLFYLFKCEVFEEDGVHASWLLLDLRLKCGDDHGHYTASYGAMMIYTLVMIGICKLPSSFSFAGCSTYPIPLMRCRSHRYSVDVFRISLESAVRIVPRTAGEQIL